MRNTLLTIVVVAAVAAVWGVGLALLDRGDSVPDRARFASSPTARVERRPALFVVSCGPAQARDAAAGAPLGEAIPVALVEPSGELRPPVADGQRDAAAAFAGAYYAPGSSIKLLRGGADAGVLRVDRALPGFGVVGRGRCEGPASAQVAAGVPLRVALGVSDPRLGAAESGLRPMRAAHRAAAERLVREQVLAGSPGARVDSVEEMSVRVADLNRDGAAEILASAVVLGREADGRPLAAHCFVIAEPAAGGDGYVAAFACVAPAGGAGLREYVDQVDLSPAEYDEVVTAVGGGADRSYAVLRRDAGGWCEVYRSPALPAE